MAKEENPDDHEVKNLVRKQLWGHAINVSTETHDKTAQQLTVAYLAGPAPLHDWQVLKEFGCLARNTYVVDKDLRSDAGDQILEAGAHPVRDTIQDFCRSNLCPVFDIVYLDFTQTFFSSINAVVALLYFERLAPQSVLITNFSYNSRGIPEAERVFYEKYFQGGTTENETTTSMRDRDKKLYGDFITNQLIEIAMYLVPWLLMNSNSSTDEVRRYIDAQQLRPTDLNPSSVLAKILKCKKLGYDDHLIQKQKDVLKNTLELIWDIKCNRGGIRDEELKQQSDKKRNEIVSDLTSHVSRQIDDEINMIFSNIILEENYLKNLSFCNDIGLCEIVTSLERLGKAFEDSTWDMTDRTSNLFNLEPERDTVECCKQLMRAVIGRYAKPHRYDHENSCRFTYKANKVQMFLDICVFDRDVDTYSQFNWLGDIPTDSDVQRFEKEGTLDMLDEIYNVEEHLKQRVKLEVPDSDTNSDDDTETQQSGKRTRGFVDDSVSNKRRKIQADVFSYF